MTPDRFARIKAIFVRALELPAGERDGFLSRECAGDAGLCSEVEALLAHSSDETLAAAPPGTEQARPRLEPGRVLAGRYRISTLLGRGAMGEVYLARDLTLDVEVALKLLLSSAPDAVAKLLDEVRLARQVTHPSVCRVFDVAEVGGEPFLTMEYIAGADLRAVLKRVGRLAPDKVRDVGIQLCQGLAAAHGSGVLHRDLKPSNVILDADGRVHITDFGIAVPTNTGGHGLIAGTPAYMAPELFSGEGRATERSDLYAVGLILYEAATGQPTTTATTLEALATARREQGTVAPARLVPELDAELDALICALLDPSPEKRPASAFEVAERLQRTGAPPRIRRAPRPRRWLAVLAVAGVAALGMVAVRMLGERSVVGPDSMLAPATAKDGRIGIAVLPFTSTGTSPEDQHLVDGIHAELITELSKVHDLRVISRASVVRVGTTDNLAELGRKLGVSAIAEGSVRRVSDRVRVHVELVDAHTGEDLWSQSYDRAFADDNVFEIESEMAQEIAARVGARLSPEDRARIEADTATTTKACDLYLSARGLETAGTAPTVAEALVLVRRALAEDPSLARAWALSGVLNVRAARWRLLAPAVAYPAARDAAQRALALDGTFSEAHAVLCEVLSEYDRDWEAAEAACRRAIELNGSSERAFSAYARLLAARGRREESANAMMRAWEIDPTSGIMQAVAADLWLQLGEYERAIAAAKVATTLAPDYPPAHATLGLAQLRREGASEGVRNLEHAAELATREPIALALLGYGYGLAGRAVDARIILVQLQRLSGDRSARPDELFLVHLGLGQTDRALELLARVVEDRSPLAMWLAVSPLFDPLRADPRFASLVREAGLAG